MQQWNLSEAKNKLSEVVNLVLLEGPQRITRRNDRFVIMTEDQYEALGRPEKSFAEFLLEKGPSFEGIEIVREKSVPRYIDFGDLDDDSA